MRKKITSEGKLGFDKWLVLLAFLLTIFGVVMVYDASVVSAFETFGDKFHFVKQQVMWAGVGWVVLVIVALFPIDKLKKLSVVAWIVILALLLAVLIPGVGTKVMGARRWIFLGGVNFQPAELAKLVFVVYLSALFEKRKDIVPFLLNLVVFCGLIVLEPDLGTAVIIGTTALAMFFVAGGSLLYFAGLVPAVGLGGLVTIMLSPYRLVRLKTFFNLSEDPLGSSYHVRQVLLTLGSGGLLGVGLGSSRQKYAYLPEATTDSIFAVIAEELGFLGALALIGIFAWLFLRGFRVAERAKSDFTRNLAVGLTLFLAVQTLVNLAAMVALVPLTGVPLPFISYGGSALVVELAAVGLLVNVSREK